MTGTSYNEWASMCALKGYAVVGNSSVAQALDHQGRVVGEWQESSTGFKCNLSDSHSRNWHDGASHTA